MAQSVVPGREKGIVLRWENRATSLQDRRKERGEFRRWSNARSKSKNAGMLQYLQRH
jgi:hypothetical protein